MSLLRIRELTISVREGGQEKILVNNIDLQIPQLSIVALVGGSGSGKTTTGLSILRLLPLGLNIKKGSIHFREGDLLKLPDESMRQLRGKEISMIFQEPLNALNPVYTIGYQIDEVLRFHTKLNHQNRRQRILDILNLVGMPDPKQFVKYYPHQLSGGMRQRAMIAQAIAAEPKLIIADEPTSNLDVTLQARIMELFRKLKDQLKLSMLLITHDLGMVAHLADQIAVMTEGKIVEQGETRDLLEKAQHPYTRQLMQAIEG